MYFSSKAIIVTVVIVVIIAVGVGVGVGVGLKTAKTNRINSDNFISQHANSNYAILFVIGGSNSVGAPNDPGMFSVGEPNPSFAAYQQGDAVSRIIPPDDVRYWPLFTDGTSNVPAKANPNVHMYNPVDDSVQTAYGKMTWGEPRNDIDWKYRWGFPIWVAYALQNFLAYLSIDPSKKVLIVHCGVEDTGLNPNALTSWHPNAVNKTPAVYSGREMASGWLYGPAIKMINRFSGGNCKLFAILWHGGESDRQYFPSDPNFYKDSLTTLFDSLASDIKVPSVLDKQYIITSEVQHPDFVTDSYSRYANTKDLNIAIRQTADSFSSSNKLYMDCTTWTSYLPAPSDADVALIAIDILRLGNKANPASNPLLTNMICTNYKRDTCRGESGEKIKDQSCYYCVHFLGSQLLWLAAHMFKNGALKWWPAKPHWP